MDIKELEVIQEPDEEGLAKIKVTCRDDSTESFWVTDCKPTYYSMGWQNYEGVVDNELILTDEHEIIRGHLVKFHTVQKFKLNKED